MKKNWLLRVLSALACLALTVGFAACDFSADDGDDGAFDGSGAGSSEIVGGNEGEGGENAGNEEQTPPSEGLEFAINDDGTAYIVTGIGACQDTKIVIPAEYEGLPVTWIGSYAFYNCDSLTSVTIGNSVTSIGEGAFCHCDSLTSIEIPDSVTSIGGSAFYNTGYYNEESNWEDDVLYIGKHLIEAKDTLEGEYAIKEGTLCVADSAFYECTSLTSIEIPDSVTSIGSYAFSRCTSLTSVNYLGTIEQWCNISFSDYANPLSYGANLYLNNELVTELVIPDTVTEIKDYAFYNCSSLTSIEIPDSVTSIGCEAFYNTGYYNEESNWEDDVLYIGKHLIEAKYTLAGEYAIKEGTLCIADYAFYHCDSLTSITIPDSVTSIGSGAFSQCYSLTSVYITDIAAWCTISFGNSTANPLYYAKNLYLNNELVTKLVIPDTVTKIKNYAFVDCTSLTSIEIPDSVTSIGSGAFAYCLSLTSVEIPDSVTSIGNYAFYECTRLKSITVDEDNENYKSIDGNLYSKDGAILIQYAIGKTATEFTIPDSVTSIGFSAFEDCTSLTNIEIPDSVTSIGFSAFEDCTSLTNIEIPDSVTSIGDYAFYNCSSLTSIEIPDSVTSIGSGAFAYCLSLTSVEIPDSVTSIGYSAFRSCDDLTSVTIGDSVTSIGYSAFRSCDDLTSVVIGDGVTSIGDEAFSECTSLTSVYYKGTAEEWSAISIGSYTYLTDATRYYYSESEPTEEGNYWYYNENGEIVVW